MEKLKDPAMILSTANTAVLAGFTFYFYKQIESINTDIGKLSQATASILGKLGEMSKEDQRKTETLHTLSEELRKIIERIDDLPSFEEFAGVNSDITEIVATLEDNNIIVERPSQSTRSRRSGDRRVSRRTTFDSDTETKELPRRSSIRPSTRDYDIKQSVQQSGQDDLDVIEQVRRQQIRR